MTNSYQTLYSGFNEVAIEYQNDSLWEPKDPEVAETIEETIEEEKKRAKREGNEFFDGPLVRVKESELIDDETLNLILENTSYFMHAATREESSLSKENRADPLSVGARVKTSDNYIVIGERADWTDKGSGEYQLAGAGFIEDPTTQYQRSLNAEPVSPINREIEEEIGVDASQMERPIPTDLIGAVTYQPMLVYNAKTELSNEDVASEWAEIPNEDKEFSSLAFIAENEAAESTNSEAIAEFATVDENLEFELEEDTKDIPLRPHAEGALENL